MTPNTHNAAEAQPHDATASPTAPPALERLVSTHPFLQGLTFRHLSVLSAHAMRSHFGAGQLIFREGDLANRFYLLVTGQVALESYTKERGRILIQTIGPGEVLGWSWLFPPFTWHFDARALEPTEAIFFYGTRLREQCEEDRDLGYELIRRAAQVLIERLQATRKKLLLAHTQTA